MLILLAVLVLLFFFMAGTGAFLLLLVSALGLVLLFVAISRPNKLWGPSGAQIEKY